MTEEALWNFFLRKGRLDCVHLKDMLDAESQKMCWVGNGTVMDYEK